uniref:Uncharacterized protein n=1 Tax=Arundo donax TaxID=35708 RepID=A0A0A9G000_ARUDO
MQPLLPGEPSWHSAEDMVEQIVPCVYSGSVTIMAIKNGEDGEGGVRRGRGRGGGGGGARAVRPEQEEVLTLLGLRGAPVPQQRPLPRPLRGLPSSGGWSDPASLVLVARADPAPTAACAALRAGLLLDERGERHEPAPAALAPVVVVRRRRRRRRRHSPALPDRIEAGGGTRRKGR